MRKTLFVLLLCFTFLLTSCGTNKPQTDGDDTSEVFGSAISSSSETLAPTEPTKEITKNHDTKPSLPQNESTVRDESKTAETNPEKPSEESTRPTDTIKADEPAASKPGTVPPEPSDSGEKESTVSTPAEPTVPAAPNATALDSSVIAELVVQYLNSYRTAQGTTAAVQLSGLTEYAKYRSRQLVSDFSHNTNDERAAATALSYGMYVDPTLYGMSGEPYYTACSGEAIAKAGYTGTVDYVAKSLADLIRNSSAHWAYIGSSEYRYIGVGITYESGMWYCDVALTRENYG